MPRSFPSLVRLSLWRVACAFIVAGSAATASAQPTAGAPWEGPISIAVVDLRASLAKYPSGVDTSAPRGIAANTLPDFGWGGEAGVHVYPLRGRRVTLGLGGSALWTRRTATPDAPAGSSTAPPSATTKFRVIAGHVSMNFGDRDGWSYLSGGVGRATLSIAESEGPDDDSGSLTTWHYGGGARWFRRTHLAFTFDVRFYRIPAGAATSTYAGNPAFTSAVGSVGVAFR